MSSVHEVKNADIAFPEESGMSPSLLYIPKELADLKILYCDTALQSLPEDLTDPKILDCGAAKQSTSKEPASILTSLFSWVFKTPIAEEKSLKQRQQQNLYTLTISDLSIKQRQQLLPP
jgi:hypothetical protein